MINWMYFPKNQPLDAVSRQVVAAFENIADSVDSNEYQYSSNEVLSIVRPGLENLGFAVEKSKKSSDLVVSGHPW